MATVLLVEDEDVLRETLSRYLAREGHDVISAASGYEALEAGLEASPDVLVADWMLKNHIHGLHLSEVFRALHPSLNTILITGFSSRDLLEESDRCGVSRLLEKPFDLQNLQDAVSDAMTESTGRDGQGPPIAAISIDEGGGLNFRSPRASELFEAAGVPRNVTRLDEIIQDDVAEALEGGTQAWVEVQSRHDASHCWLLRSRRRPGRIGWLVVLCPREEEPRRSDLRLRILLDQHVVAEDRALDDPSPVLVIERDGVVRRLLVSQIERIGAICYASDDLHGAMRLLVAEPRAVTVMIDFALAGTEMSSWVDQVRTVRPEARIIGTGGIGAEADLLAQGVSRVLCKPWRIDDLLEVIEN